VSNPLTKWCLYYLRCRRLISADFCYLTAVSGLLFTAHRSTSVYNSNKIKEIFSPLRYFCGLILSNESLEFSGGKTVFRAYFTALLKQISRYHSPLEDLLFEISGQKSLYWALHPFS